MLQGLHQLCQANHLWHDAECIEAEELQKIELVVAGSRTEVFYDTVKAARTPGSLQV